jgi:hypothetical protein
VIADEITPRASPASSAGRVGPLVVLLLFPLVLLGLDHSWAFTSPDYLDPWFYLGYFLNLPQHMVLFDGSYYNTRLSVILPGYVAYRLLPPLAANYALHLGMYYAGVFSLYLILAQTVSRRAALLAALCMGGSYFFLRAVGWDYVDGYGITYLLLATLALTRAAHGPPRPVTLIAAGAACAGLVIANAFYVVYLPFLLASHVFFQRSEPRRNLLVGLFWYTLGGVAFTLLGCLASWKLTGRFWFFVPNFVIVNQLMAAPNPWSHSPLVWLKWADWLVLPVLATLAGLVRLVGLRRQGAVRSSEVYYQVQLATALAMLVVWACRGEPVLQTFYYASLLIPFTYLAFGAQLAQRVDALSPARFRFLVGIVLVGLTAPYALVRLGIGIHLHGWSAAIVFAVGLIGLLVPVFRRESPAVGWACLFVGFSSFIAAGNFESRLSLPGTAYFQTLAHDHYRPQDTLRAVVRSMRAVRQIDPTGHTLFWYNSTQPGGALFSAVNSTYIWAPRLLGTDFPQVDPGRVRALGNQVVAILSLNPDAAALADASLAPLGLHARLLREERIQCRTITFPIRFVVIEPRPAAEQPLTVPTTANAPATLVLGAAPLPADWQPCYDSTRMSVTPQAEGLRVQTCAQPWAHAVIYPPLTVAEAGTYRFEIDYTLESGEIVFGALPADRSRWLAQAGPPTAPGVLSVAVPLKPGEVVRLVVANSSSPEQARFVLRQVRAFRLSQPADPPSGRTTLPERH